MSDKNTASVRNLLSEGCNESSIQKDSVKTLVRAENDGNNSKLKITVSIVEDKFPDYCQGKIDSADILDKLMAEVGYSRDEACRYFNDIQKQILQDEL